MNIFLSFIVGIVTVLSGYGFYTDTTPREMVDALGSTMTGSAWFLNASQQIQAGAATWGLRVPSLVSCNTIDTDGNGVFTCGTDATGGGGGGGSPIYIQTDGVTQSSGGTTTLNFTSNSFALTESPADTFSFRVSTTTLGLLASSISDFVSTARTSISETITGLTYTSGTGVLSIDSGYEIPTTTRMATWDAKGNGTVTSVAMSVPTGLSISGTPITTSGTLALTYGAGYAGVLTASTTNWNGFYDVPSTRITAGTGIDWSGNTLNGVYTAGDGITLNTEDFDCDTASTSIFGCLSSTDWNIFNNKLASTSIDTSAELDTIVTDDTGSGALVFANTPTLAGLVTLDYASTTGISGTNLNFTNATSSTSFFSALGTFTDLIVNTLATFLNVVVTGLLDIGDGVLEIPNSTDPTVDSVGETAVNTSTSSLRFHDGTAERQIKSEWAWGSTLASSSLSADGAFSTGGTTTAKRAGFRYGVTHTEYYCRTNVGNVTIVIGDGTASSSPLRCTASGATTTASNGAFDAREMINLAVGSADGNTLTTDIYFDATARWTTD